MLVGMLAWLYRYDHEGSGRDVNFLERSAGIGTVEHAWFIVQVRRR